MKGSLIYLPERGISLYVRIVGSGPPVLLMHGGLGADHSTLLALLPLAGQFQLIFYDHRANGRSGGRAESLSWQSLADDAEALRRHLGIGKWTVIGHSFGACIALEYGLRHSKSCIKLVLLDGGAAAQQQQAHRVLAEHGCGGSTLELARKFYNGNLDSGRFLLAVLILGRHYFAKPSPSRLLAEAMRGLRIRAKPAAASFGFKVLMAGWSVLARLPEIAIPTLVVAGQADFLFPPAHQAILAAGIPGAQLRILAGAGHNAHVEKARTVIRIVRQFLGQTTA